MREENNTEKSRALVHYVCSVCKDTTLLSETKLHKSLWFADTYAYRQLGKDISGVLTLRSKTGR